MYQYIDWIYKKNIKVGLYTHLMKMSFRSYNYDHYWTNRIILGILFTFQIIITESHARQTDVRWLSQPDLTVKVIESENVTLRWVYKKPPPTRNLGKVMFAHHIPGNSFEDMLIEGKIHPTTGELTLVYVMFPGKVTMTCRGQEILVHIRDMALSEYGRYLMDLKFDSDAAMHDVIDLRVFKNPTWIQTPQTEIHVRSDSHVTLKWKRDSGRDLPAIHGISLLYNDFSDDQTIEVIHTSKLADSNIWEIDYAPEGLHLSDRMLHEYNPQRDVFQVSVWDLEVSDSGQYSLRLSFEDHVTELEHTVDLHVVEGSTWKIRPGSEVFGVLSKSVNLTYTPNINDTELSPLIQKYKLYKYRDRKEEEVMEIAVTEDGLTERRQRSINISQKIGVTHTPQEDDEFGLLLTFKDIHVDHNGSYLLKMFLEDTLVVKHSFNFRVVDADDLWPTVLSDSKELDIIQLPTHVTKPGLHSFRPPPSLPHPRMILYSGSDEDSVTHADIRQPETVELWLVDSWLDQGITVVMDYGFYTLSFKLTSSKSMSLSSAAFISTMNQHAAEAIIVYITCFCLLAGNVLILVVSCWIWRHHHKHKCHPQCTSAIQHQHPTNENIYEIPLRRLTSDETDDVGFRNPRLRKPGVQSTPSDQDREALLPRDKATTPLFLNTSLDEPSPILRSSAASSPNGSGKRVRWEGVPPLSYEQVEQHSPKLPRY